jgi:hypothetical protein
MRIETKALLTVGVVLLVGVAATNTFAGIPDSEDICQDLKNASHGLYGLCMAFWASFYCEWDYSEIDIWKFCRPANGKILEKYRAKMQPGDPDMPGVASPCPCWSEEFLIAIPPDYWPAQCFWSTDTEQGTGGAEYSWNDYVDPGNPESPSATWGIYAFWYPGLETLCHVHSWCGGRPECEGYEETHLVIEISYEQYLACRAQIIETAIEREYSCSQYGFE